MILSILTVVSFPCVCIHTFTNAKVHSTSSCFFLCFFVSWQLLISALISRICVFGGKAPVLMLRFKTWHPEVVKWTRALALLQTQAHTHTHTCSGVVYGTFKRARTIYIRISTKPHNRGLAATPFCLSLMRLWLALFTLCFVKLTQSQSRPQWHKETRVQVATMHTH